MVENSFKATSFFFLEPPKDIRCCKILSVRGITVFNSCIDLLSMFLCFDSLTKAYAGLIASSISQGWHRHFV